LLFPQTLVDRLALLAEDRTALTALPSGFGALGRLALRSPAAAPLARLLSRRQQRLVRAYHLIRAAGLFDRSWYLNHHPVPARGRTDPLRHFLEEGTARGFLPAAEWVGLDAESCAALANRHGKAGRELWRYTRYGRAPGFSRSSLELLARAYPGLGPTRTELRPHRVDYLPSRPVALDFAADLHDALLPLLRLPLDDTDFEPEVGQIDGTLAHAVERLFVIAAQIAGYRLGVIEVREAEATSWSSLPTTCRFGTPNEGP
jgi:hypothetical protein